MEAQPSAGVLSHAISDPERCDLKLIWDLFFLGQPDFWDIQKTGALWWLVPRAQLVICLTFFFFCHSPITVISCLPTTFPNLGKVLLPQISCSAYCCMWSYILSFLSAIACGWSKKHKCFRKIKEKKEESHSWHILHLEQLFCDSGSALGSPEAGSLWSSPPVCSLLGVFELWWFSFLCEETNEASPSVELHWGWLRKEEETPQLLEAKQCGHPAWWMSKVSVSPSLIVYLSRVLLSKPAGG